MMRLNKSCTKSHDSGWEHQVYENMYQEGDYLLDHRDNSIICNARHRMHELKDPSKCQLLRLGPLPQKTRDHIARQLRVTLLLNARKSQAEAEAEAEADADEMMEKLRSSRIETPKQQEDRQVSRPNTHPTGHTRRLYLPRRPLFVPITLTIPHVTEPERVTEPLAADEATGGNKERFLMQKKAMPEKDNVSSRMKKDKLSGVAEKTMKKIQRKQW